MARASSFSRSMRASVSESGLAVKTVDTRSLRARAGRPAATVTRCGTARTERIVSLLPDP
jgi:hypothetical protein